MKIRINNRGFSMIGSLLGFSLLGLSTIGLANYMGSFEKVRVTYSQQSSIVFLHRELLGLAKNALTAVNTEVVRSTDGDGNAQVTTNSEGLNKFGICGVVRTAFSENNAYSKIKNSVICPVEINSSDVKNGSIDEAYGDDRWNNFLTANGNWEVLSENNCGSEQGFVGSFDGVVKKCLRHKKSNIHARVMVIPRKLPDFSDNIQDGTVHADDLFYEIITHLSVLRSSGDSSEKQYSVTKNEKLVWAFEVSGCHVCDSSDANCKLVKLSSVGLNTAAPNSSGGVCYHSHISPLDLNDEEQAKEALKVRYVAKDVHHKSDVSLEKHEDGTTARVVRASNEKARAISCNQHLFRCVREGEAGFDEKYFDPFLSLTFSLDFIQPSDSNIDSMSLSITDENKNAFNPNPKHVFVGADQETRVGGEIYGDKDSWILRGGGNEFTALISSAGMCKQICQSARDETHRSPREARPSVYYPKLEVKYNKLADLGGAGQKTFTSGKEGALFESKVDCVVCHSKSCHRHGRGVKGLRFHQNHEPTDGLVPECIIQSKIPRNLASVTTTQISGANDDNKRCVQTDGAAGGKVKLKAVSCNSSGSAAFEKGSEKAACFFQGRTRIMKSKAKGVNARRSCEQMVKEKQLISEVKDGVYVSGIIPSLANAYSVDTQVVENILAGKKPNGEPYETPKIPVPKVGNYYEFDNVANLGTFMGSHKTGFLNTLDTLDTEEGKKDVWLSIQKDAAGMFHSGWQEFQGLRETENEWAFFYREPFQTIMYHDVQTIASDISKNPECLLDDPDKPCDLKIKEPAFLGRSRPSRPIYISMSKYSEDYGRSEENDISSLDNNNSRPDNRTDRSLRGTVHGKALLLYHNIKYKGLRMVSQTTNNEYPYLCRNVEAERYKDSFVITRKTGNQYIEGFKACERLGDKYFFVPPDSIEEWSAALQAVSPNAPRYPFPNPFKFIDGIPFYYDAGASSASPPDYIKWELSFNYKDMPPGDYMHSLSTDNKIVIKEFEPIGDGEKVKMLASPAAAWVGVEPIDKTKTMHAGKSWMWRGGSNLFRNEEENYAEGPSLFSSSSRDSLDLLDDEENENNIGALTKDGYIMTAPGKKADGSLISVNIRNSDDDKVKEEKRDKAGGYLRQKNDLSSIVNNVTKICKVKPIKEMELHNALIFRGKHDDWPSGDKCNETSGKETKLTKSVYFGVPDNLGASDLEKLTGSHLEKARNGISNIRPFLLYQNQGGIHVQNAAKFCKAWKREKYRRALGRCLVNQWNSDSGGILYARNSSETAVEHSLAEAKKARTDTSIASGCHKNTDACGGVLNYYTLVRNQARADLASFDNTFGTVSGGTFSGIQQKIDQYETAKDQQCGGHTSSSNINKYDAAIAELRQQNTELMAKRNILLARKNALDNVVNAGDGLRSQCIAAITDEKSHEQSFIPQALSNLSSDSNPTKNQKMTHDTYKYNFNRSEDSKCWGLFRLKPEANYDFGGEKTGDTVNGVKIGKIGIFGDDEPYASLSKNANCYNNHASLGVISNECGGSYTDLADIGDDDLCDDDDVSEITSCEAVAASRTEGRPSDPKESIAAHSNSRLHDNISSSVVGLQTCCSTPNGCNTLNPPSWSPVCSTRFGGSAWSFGCSSRRCRTVGWECKNGAAVPSRCSFARTTDAPRPDCSQSVQSPQPPQDPVVPNRPIVTEQPGSVQN